MEITTHGHAVRKVLELVRWNVVKENLALHLLAVFLKERLDVRTRMQNVVSVVRKDEREVRATQQRVEQRTRMHALAQVFLDKQAEKYARDKNR